MLVDSLTLDWYGQMETCSCCNYIEKKLNPFVVVWVADCVVLHCSACGASSPIPC